MPRERAKAIASICGRRNHDGKLQYQAVYTAEEGGGKTEWLTLPSLKQHAGVKSKSESDFGKMIQAFDRRWPDMHEIAPASAAATLTVAHMHGEERSAKRMRTDSGSKVTASSNQDGGTHMPVAAQQKEKEKRPVVKRATKKATKKKKKAAAQTSSGGKRAGSSARSKEKATAVADAGSVATGENGVRACCISHLYCSIPPAKKTNQKIHAQNTRMSFEMCSLDVSTHVYSN